MQPELTPRQQIVLAALAGKSGAEFAPVQVQKLFFLIDENLSGQFGGKLFSFEPYHYGPYDKDVYRELENLKNRGFVSINQAGPSAAHRRYTLTPSGYAEGAKILEAMDEPIQSYIIQLSEWVRRLSFAALVGAIYRAYPSMREHSVFND